MTIWVMIGLSLGSTLVVLFLMARRNERAVREDWETLLTPKGENLYRSMEGRVRTELGMAELTFEHAQAYRELGTIDEALRLLDIGYKVIERFSPSMLRLLAAMATFSRMVSAIAPVPPMRPHDFKLVQIASLAYLNAMVHQFLVSASERFRLKVYILGRSFALASRYLMKSIRTLGSPVSEAEKKREWEQIVAIRADFQSLTDESLDSLRLLLTAMAHEDKQDLIREIASR